MRSDAVKTGSQQAPHRSLFNALGLTKEEMERPLVGIVSSYNEIVRYLRIVLYKAIILLASIDVQLRTSEHRSCTATYV